MKEHSPHPKLPDQERDLIRRARQEAARLPNIPAHAMPPPDSFSGYELRREIHRGGQGAVYQALQKSTKRKVAIKVMKEGPFASPRDRVRFDREVRILGRLNHPNIIAIHDSGSVAGQFYFVMDYVDGQPLDLWAASGQRSVKQILELGAKICDAINTAHVRGIIHRDLKPGNILIDNAGEPRILDFGLAKLAPDGSIDETCSQVMTISGQFVGSVPWASPEQAAGRPDQVDMRTDVYALGVILYQMLTGKFPYEVVGGMHEVLGNIIDNDPIKPRAIKRGIDDDVQTIVLKCLEKARDRRYQNAGELARDVRHYLADEPIEAKRNSAWYVLRKTLIRHKVRTAVVCTLAALTIISAVTGWIAYRNATQTIRLQQQAESRNQELVKLIDRFLPDAQAVEDKMQIKSPALEVLQRNVQWADDNLTDIPEFDAKLRTTIGLGYHNLGRYADSEQQLSKALRARQQLAESPPELLADGHHNLARALYFTDKLVEAQDHYTQAMVLQVEVFGADSAEVLESLNGIASCLYARGHYHEAEERFREALDMRIKVLGAKDPYTAASMNNLGRCLRDQGRFDEAEDYCRQALANLAEFGGPPLYTSRSWRSIAMCDLARGRISAAETVLKRELQRMLEAESQDPVIANTHPDVAIIRYELAQCLYDEGTLAQAKQECQLALQMQRDLLPERSTAVAETQLLLARIYIDEGDLSAAEQFLSSALALLEQLLDAGHPDIAACVAEVARLRVRQQRFDDAEVLCGKALSIQRSKLSGRHPAIASSLLVLGQAYLGQGRYEQGEQCLQDALSIWTQLLPADHWRVAWVKVLLGTSHLYQQRYEQAQRLLEAALDVLESNLGSNSYYTQRAREALVAVNKAWG